jgi:hypothetical protein
MKKFLLSILVLALAGSLVYALHRKPPVRLGKKTETVDTMTIVRLHLAPVLLDGTGEVVLQDVWKQEDQIELQGEASVLPLQLQEGFGTPDGTLVLQPALADGATFSVLLGREVGYGWKDPVDAFSGTGVVQGGVLDITLRHNSAFVLLDSRVSPVEMEPFVSTYSREQVNVPEGGLLMMLPPHSEDLAAIIRDTSGVRSAVLGAGAPGTCRVADFSADPWFALPSSLMASTLQTRNLSTGKDYVCGEYSGITKISDARYALVHNAAKGGGIYFADLTFEGGKVTSARIEAAPGTLEAKDVRDPEGIAYMSSTQTLWVSGEKDQKILEYDLEGRPTGREMAVPSDFLPAELSTGNGFESLSYSAATGEMWTVTEEPLKRDLQWFPAGEGRRMLRLQAFDGNTLAPKKQRFYAMDAPQYKPASADTYIHGVAELLAMDDGTLLVLEREVYVPSYDSANKASMLSMIANAMAKVKLYLVDPTSSKEALLSKVLVGSFYTRFPGPLSLLAGADPQLANFEGMCLGPVVDSHPTVLLVNDSERGKGNSYARLQDYIRVMLF